MKNDMKNDVKTPTPTVSVIMPAYNVAGLITRAVQSLQAQTLSNWHLHIVIDAATDNTQQVAEVLAEADARISVHPLPTNGGPSAARNFGFQQAQGKWVALLDADDAYHPARLQTLVAVAEANNLDLVSDNLTLFDLPTASPVGITWRKLVNKSPRSLTLETFLAHANPLNRFTYGLLKPMFRRSFLNRHNLMYDTRFRVGEDTLLHIHALRVGGREMLVGTPMYIYTLPRSVTSTDRSPFTQSTATNTSSNIQQATQELLTANLPGLTPAVLHQLRVRQQAYQHWNLSRTILGHLGKKRFSTAAMALFRHPGVISVMARLIFRRLSFRLLAALRLPIA